jgi:hypothetical protein
MPKAREAALSAQLMVTAASLPGGPELAAETREGRWSWRYLIDKPFGAAVVQPV